ncbi:hypothetical protein EYF80_015169 [Liparis tanakae]|uniref:Uncharacterized protein n=1 Tax=Liparis tanakae TaxID=230148 RepID=A0A4Z2IB46_9TELE|nr:hypothetical protein EYF80_015169 [Liparis tanakae]
MSSLWIASTVLSALPSNLVDSSTRTLPLRDGTDKSFMKDGEGHKRHIYMPKRGSNPAPYLVKEGVVPPLDPRPVGLSTHVHLHHWFDVVARQLAGLDDSDTDLKDVKHHRISLGEPIQRVTAASVLKHLRAPKY